MTTTDYLAKTAVKYYIWDVSNKAILDQMCFDTIEQAIAYGDSRLIYFWKEHTELYTIQELY